MPSGTGAPVMMRHALPGTIAAGAASPAPTVPCTGSWIGESADAPRTLLASTAYPSIALFRQAGCV